MNLGMSEVLLILVIALVVFGPRKLPELGKSLGQAMAQFRRASEDFKRTWEQEVEIEKVRKSEPTSAGKPTQAKNVSHAPYNPNPNKPTPRGPADKAAESHSAPASSA